MPALHTQLTSMDWIVFLAILALTGAAVWWGGRVSKKVGADDSSPLEWLLMGRRLTLPLFVTSLVATWYGGIFGVTALTFERGVFNFMTQGVFWYGTYLIFAFILVKRVRQYQSTGLADLAGGMFGTKAKKLTALLALANLLPIGYVAGLGHFLGPLLGIGWWEAALYGLLIIYAYGLWGGLRAVVYPDFIQCFVMVIAVWSLVFFCWAHHGGINFLQTHLPSTHWDPTGGNDWASLFIWGAIALGTLVDPNFHQRIQAAKDLKTARTGLILATVIWIFFDIATTLGGLYARALLPHSTPDQSYLLLGLQELPSGMRGLFLAGILATILSTLDSFLFTAGASLSSDLLGRNSKWWLKGGMIFCGISAWLIAPLFGGSIVLVWKTLGGMISACLLPALLWGLWRPKTLSEKGFLFSVVLGIVSMTLFALMNFYYPSGIDEFYAGLLGSILGLVIALTRRTLVVSRP
ncbi:MAG: sodium:solute symporter family protein [Bacteriovoracaceae bacterium]|nr:sodium:solute symporter family protein [Bacteriovoracaceae bacterium]